MGFARAKPGIDPAVYLGAGQVHIGIIPDMALHLHQYPSRFFPGKANGANESQVYLVVMGGGSRGGIGYPEMAQRCLEGLHSRWKCGPLGSHDDVRIPYHRPNEDAVLDIGIVFAPGIRLAIMVKVNVHIARRHVRKMILQGFELLEAHIVTERWMNVPVETILFVWPIRFRASEGEKAGIFLPFYANNKGDPLENDLRQSSLQFIHQM